LLIVGGSDAGISKFAVFLTATNHTKPDHAQGPF